MTSHPSSDAGRVLARVRALARRCAASLARSLLACQVIACVNAVESTRDRASTAGMDAGPRAQLEAGHAPHPDVDSARTSTPDAWPPDDAEEEMTADAGEGGFITRVVDSTDTQLTLGGVRVALLDDVTGLPLRPPVEGISDADGRIALDVQPGLRFAVRAYATASHTDTFSFHYDPARELPPIRMGSNNAANVLPMVAQYRVREDRAPVAGNVLWKTATMDDYQPVGCVRIEVRGADVRSLDLRYSAENIPSSLASWPLDRGTNPQNGRFFIANMTSGQHTLVAKLPDGSLLGSTKLAVFPRSEASSVVAGHPANLFIATLYIDAPGGSQNPTPGACTSHCDSAPELCAAASDAGTPLDPRADAGDAAGPGPAEAALEPDAAVPSLSCGDRPCEGITLSNVTVRPCCVPDELDRPTDRCGLSADDIKRALPSSPFLGCLPRDVPRASASAYCGDVLDQFEPEGDHQNGGLDVRSGSRIAVYEGCCLPEGECGAEIGVPRGASEEFDMHLGCVSFARLRDAFGPAEFLPPEPAPFCDPATGGAP